MHLKCNFEMESVSKMDNNDETGDREALEQ